MKLALRFLCSVTLFLILAHRLPAPISEAVAPTPTEAPAKSKAAPARHKAGESSEGNSARRFDGTWRGTGSSKNQAGTFNRTGTLTIKNGTAEFTSELTSTLIQGKKWTDLPAPYNSVSPIYQKLTNKSTEVKAEGSNIRIHWQGGRLTDWAPKTIPLGVFKNAVGQPTSVLCILSGQQLIVTNGKQSATYTRIQ